MSKTNNKLLGTSIFLALSSSLCCILPILALFGSAGSTIALFTWIAPLRPYLLAATALLLILAFYRAYKPNSATSNCNTNCKPKRTFLQSKTFLWIITVLTIVLSALPYYAPLLQKKNTIVYLSDNAQTTQAVFQIEGMTCSACEQHVNGSLQTQLGIKNVSTSYQNGEATVQFDSTQISTQEIQSIIERETGYKIIR